MEHVEIEFDTPAAVYFPGQQVGGKVTFRNQNGLNALSLKICIRGEAHTFWDKFVAERRRDRAGRYHQTSEHINLSSKINYLEGECQPWSSLDGITNKIPAGVNVFPFTFQLPFNCPPSFEGTHGTIRYSVNVELNRPWRFNAATKRVFSVVPLVDLNTIPQSINPMVSSACKHSGFLSHKEVKVRVNLPKRGWVPGEMIPILIDIENHAKKPIYEARAHLVQHVHYSSQKGHSHLFPKEHCDRHWEHKRAETRMSEILKSIRVECCSRSRLELALVVPQPLVASFKIPIIEVDYCVQVFVGEGEKLKCEFPCIIGSVPVRQMVTPLPPNYQEASLKVASQTETAENIPPPAYSASQEGPSAPEMDDHF